MIQIYHSSSIMKIVCCLFSYKTIYQYSYIKPWPFKRFFNTTTTRVKLNIYIKEQLYYTIMKGTSYTINMTKQVNKITNNEYPKNIVGTKCIINKKSYKLTR